MSQAKVNRYKEEKANRKKILAKEKRIRILSRTICGVICAAILAWAGVSAYNSYEESRPAETYYCDSTALQDYMSSLSD